MRNLLDFIFPENIYCISCGSIIDRTRNYSLCDTCMKNMHWITGRHCLICGKALPDTYDGSVCYDCLAYGHIFDEGISAVEYGTAERALIMDFKYNGKSYYKRPLGEIMADRLALESWDIDYITSVPIHESRLAERGYNQSELLAREVGKRINIPYKEVLYRKENTRPMKGMSRIERREALKGMFEVVPSREPVMGEGDNILIVDDIYTTGSTFDACAEMLKANGAGKVYCLAFASGANRRISTE